MPEPEPIVLSAMLRQPTTAIVLRPDAPQDGVTVNLGMSMQAQDQTNWCWAASAKSVYEYLHKQFNMAQCIYASIGWKPIPGPAVNCCLTPATCNQRGLYDPEISAMYHSFVPPVTFNYYGGTPPRLSIQDCKNSINRSQPCEIGWSWTGGGGHVAIIGGYYVYDDGPFGDQYLSVFDPATGASSYYTWSELLNAKGQGVLDACWLNLQSS